MFDRSAILSEAWQSYRTAVARGHVSAKGFDRTAFGNKLRAAWERAKYRAALEARFAALDAQAARSERETELRNRLLVIECADRLDVVAYSAVSAELAAVRRAAA